MGNGAGAGAGAEREPNDGSEGGAKADGAGRRWRDLLITLAVAALVLIVADVELRRVTPPKYVREVQEALADYKHEDPTVLVLGSSHARTFATMNALVGPRTNDHVRILSVPLEWGKFRSYEWALQHRLMPFIDEGKPGPLKRPSLKHFILLSAWWDACWKDGDPPVFNLPSRAWALGDFAESVAADGLNDHSRNYLQSRWQEIFHGSILVSDRGQGRLFADLHDLALPPAAKAKEAQHHRKLESWQELMERGSTCGDHREELAAAERMIRWAQGRGYDVTLMLYPMMPVTVTEKSRREVQEPFERTMKALAEKTGVRFVDATFDHNVNDADFQPDFDHLTPSGHVKFSEWLLQNRLQFLLEGTPAASGPRGQAPGGTP